MGGAAHHRRGVGVAAAAATSLASEAGSSAKDQSAAPGCLGAAVGALERAFWRARA